MYGKPKDVEGQCNAHLYIGDDYGDNHATMRCHLPKGHKGVHCEQYTGSFAGSVQVTWENDERDFQEDDDL